MGAEGIGASVARKEDKRFITGKGRYTDDMTVPGMKHAVFVRSPHAHAKVRGMDKSAALALPGVIDVLDGKQLTEDGIGNLICGWMIHSKDGSPMNMGAWRPIAEDTVRYVGDAVAVVVADTRAQAREAAEAVAVDYEELPAVTDSRAALEDGAPQIHENAPATRSMTGKSVTVRKSMRPWQVPRMSPASTSSTTGWFPMPWSRAPRSASTTWPKITIPAGRRRRTRTSHGLS